MTIPIATVIRTSLPDTVWRKGHSVTYQDTSYTRALKKTRWSSKYLGYMTPREQSAVKTKIKKALVAAGHTVDDVQVYCGCVLVYKTTPIQITELA